MKGLIGKRKSGHFGIKLNIYSMKYSAFKIKSMNRWLQLQVSNYYGCFLMKTT